MCKATTPRVQLPNLQWAAGQNPAPRLRSHLHGDMGEKPVEIDACMVDLIKQLNENGFTTTSCCCGHHRTDAYINLDNHVCLIIHLNDDKVTFAPDIPPYYSKFDVEHDHCATDGLTFEKLKPKLEEALSCPIQS